MENKIETNRELIQGVFVEAIEKSTNIKVKGILKSRGEKDFLEINSGCSTSTELVEIDFDTVDM